MTDDLNLTIEQKNFARDVRSNPRFRGRGFKDKPRHRRYQIYSFTVGILLALIGGLLLSANYSVGYVFIALAVLAFHFLALPYIFAFVGYWFPSFTLWAAKLDYWLEKDFKE